MKNNKDKVLINHLLNQQVFKLKKIWNKMYAFNVSKI